MATFLSQFKHLAVPRAEFIEQLQTPCEPTGVTAFFQAFTSFGGETFNRYFPKIVRGYAEIFNGESFPVADAVALNSLEFAHRDPIGALLALIVCYLILRKIVKLLYKVLI